MRPFPQQPPIEHPVVPWISGDHAATVHLEDTPRRSFTAGLQRLGGDPQATDLVAVLARWDDCARVVFARYNGKNDRTPDADGTERSAPIQRVDDT